MLNVKTEVVGKILTITVDLSKRHGASASGKTTIIASSQGNQKLPHPFENVAFGVNVYTNRGD
jgi:hypothetical protein